MIRDLPDRWTGLPREVRQAFKFDLRDGATTRLDNLKVKWEAKEQNEGIQDIIDWIKYLLKKAKTALSINGFWKIKYFGYLDFMRNSLILMKGCMDEKDPRVVAKDKLGYFKERLKGCKEEYVLPGLAVKLECQRLAKLIYPNSDKKVPGCFSWVLWDGSGSPGWSGFLGKATRDSDYLENLPKTKWFPKGTKWI